MTTLNYKHLRYFWMVAKSGSIAKASEQLHITPQSISGQIGELEQSLGIELFRRAGRGLDLTEAGHRILGYADQIFMLGDELLDTVHAGTLAQELPFRVGIADSVPKLVAYRLVQPSLTGNESIKLICREGGLTTLLADLAIHRLDMIIADRPIPDNLNVRGYAHFLGESGISIFGAAPLHKNIKGKFPENLSGQPFLMPGADVALHARLMRWFESERIHPRLIGEFDDSALLKAFGQGGAGFFPAPTAIEQYVEGQHAVTVLGRIESVREQIYAITNERRLTHPIVAGICRIAQDDVFSTPSGRKRER